MTYYEQNKERRLAYGRNVQRVRIKSLRVRVLNLLGDVCGRCGFTDPRALQIDHVESGGCVEQKKYGTGIKYLGNVLSSIIESESKYQLLCANCNWIKRFENEEHRGISERRKRPPIKEKFLFEL